MRNLLPNQRNVTARYIVCQIEHRRIIVFDVLFSLGCISILIYRKINYLITVICFPNSIFHPTSMIYPAQSFQTLTTINLKNVFSITRILIYINSINIFGLHDNVNDHSSSHFFKFERNAKANPHTTQSIYQVTIYFHSTPAKLIEQ